MFNVIQAKRRRTQERKGHSKHATLYARGHSKKNFQELCFEQILETLEWYDKELEYKHLGYFQQRGELVEMICKNKYDGERQVT